MTDAMVINSVVRDDEALLVVRGEIDALTAAEVGTALHGLLTRSQRVLVDMSGVTFLGMDGVRILGAIRYRAARTGRSFRVISLSVAASRIFTLLAGLNLAPGETIERAQSELLIPHTLQHVEPLGTPAPGDARARFESVAAKYRKTMVSAAAVCAAASHTYSRLGRTVSGTRAAYFRQRASVMRGRAANAEQCARGAFDPCP